MVEINIQDIEDIYCCDNCGILLNLDNKLFTKNCSYGTCSYDGICPLCKNKLHYYKEI